MKRSKKIALYLIAGIASQKVLVNPDQDVGDGFTPSRKMLEYTSFFTSGDKPCSYIFSFFKSYIAGIAVLVCAACSENDNGTTDTDDTSSASDADSDTDSDADTDSDQDTDSDSATDDDCVHPEVVKDCSEGYCRIPHGCYTYGAPDTETCKLPYVEFQTEVTLTRDFIISETETTQAQWEALGLKNPSNGEQSPELPLNAVNWYETLVYLNALSKQDGLEPCYDLSGCHGEFALGLQEITGLEFACDYDVRRYPNIYECPGWRLPTRAEWTYAAKAGTTTSTYNGDIVTGPNDGCQYEKVLEDIAWYCHNTKRSMPVGLKQPNAWGLYDTLGNLEEWTSDVDHGWMIGNGKPAITDPTGSNGVGLPNILYGLQGGSYVSLACLCRPSVSIGERSNQLWNGFRAARTIMP